MQGGVRDVISWLRRAYSEQASIQMHNERGPRLSPEFTNCLSVVCSQTIDLTHRQAWIVELRHAHELTWDRIAVVLGWDESTVKKDYYKACKRIAEVVEFEALTSW